MLEDLEKDLTKSIVTTNTLTSGFKFIDESSRRSGAFNDPLYIPFYYHLGKYLKPNNLLEIGTDLGFISSCFLKSCKTVDYLLTVQNKSNNHWDEKLGRSNIKRNYKKTLELYHGDLLDKDLLDKIESKTFNLAIINFQGSYDNLFTLCDFIYLRLNEDGFIVMDFIKSNKKNEEIFFNIANGYKKEYKVFNTRYGTGVIKK